MNCQEQKRTKRQKERLEEGQKNQIKLKGMSGNNEK